MPKYLPPNSYFDDPADKIDRADRAEPDMNMAFSLACALHARVHEWITRGRNRAKDRALRSDICILYLSAHFLGCKRPDATWVGNQHGVSRQRASFLGIQFSKEFADYLQFRGQRFLNQAHAVPKKRRGRERRGRKGPQPGPVAGA